MFIAVGGNRFVLHVVVQHGNLTSVRGGPYESFCALCSSFFAIQCVERKRQ